MTQRITKLFRSGFMPLLSFGLLLLSYMALSLTLPSTFPPLSKILQFLLAEFQSGELLFHLGMTLRRVILAFVIAYLLGACIGVLLGLSRRFNALFDLWLIFFLNIPALVIIAICYIQLGLNETAAILAVVINKIPLVVVNFREGAKALDDKFKQMASVYKLTNWENLRHVILPQLMPFALSAARNGIALIWKIVLVVELLGRPNGVGFQIHLYFQLYEMEAIFGYAICFILIMQAVEWFLLIPWEKRCNKWREFENKNYS